MIRMMMMGLLCGLMACVSTPAGAQMQTWALEVPYLEAKMETDVEAYNTHEQTKDDAHSVLTTAVASLSLSLSSAQAAIGTTVSQAAYDDYFDQVSALLTDAEDMGEVIDDAADYEIGQYMYYRLSAIIKLADLLESGEYYYENWMRIYLSDYRDPFTGAVAQAKVYGLQVGASLMDIIMDAEAVAAQLDALAVMIEADVAT